jgi:hypothetical protein
MFQEPGQNAIQLARLVSFNIGIVAVVLDYNARKGDEQKM